MSLQLFLAFVLITLATAHTNLGEPKPTVSRSCRVGGVHIQGFKDCPGPCPRQTLTPMLVKNKNLTSPNNPDRIYYRGQRVSIKYHRNNHGPGGFLRVALVPLRKMMDRKTHAQNAFHYSCWGAVAVAATKSERKVDADGFSVAGGDGNLHDGRPSYYEVKVTIPTVIPNGIYVLGFVWFGGIGGKLHKNRPSNPFKMGHFTDYWACAYVKIQGGKPLQKNFAPVFKGDVKAWGNACWSANAGPGICKYEPCNKTPGSYNKPSPFQGTKKPKMLTPANFS